MDASSRNTNPQFMSELAVIVRAVNDSGVSYEQMAQRANKPELGLKISGSYLHKIASGRATPTAQMIPALARALRRTESEIREAIARSAGVHVERGIDYQTSRLLSVVGEMGPARRDLWQRLAMALAVEMHDDELAGTPQTAVTTVDAEPVAELPRKSMQREFDRGLTAAQREHDERNKKS